MLGSQAPIFGMGAVAVLFLLLTPSGSRHSGRTLPVFVRNSPTPVGRGKLRLGWPQHWGVGVTQQDGAAAAGLLHPK